jgi:hypothetical protein
MVMWQGGHPPESEWAMVFMWGMAAVGMASICVAIFSKVK